MKLSRVRRKPTALTGLRVVSVGAGSLQLHRAGILMEVGALSADVFRLRVARGSAFDPAPSWAVGKPAWSTAGASVELQPGSATVSTNAGRLRLDRRTGAWELRDVHGLTVFSAAAADTGFSGPRARIELELAEGEAVFGLGESTGPMNKRGLVREFWNIDVLGHAPLIHPGLRSLYVSIPFALSLRDGRAGGLFWDNPARQTWDLGQTRPEVWELTAEAGEIDLYLFLGPTVEGVVERYTGLTGRIPLPPRWALGYHQCRYSYETAARLEEVAREFRRRKLPCDALYLDIHHLDGHRVFTFGAAFPKPDRMLARLRRQGFKVVAIVNPGVKDEPGFGVLRRGRKAGAFVRDASGRGDFRGEVWPGRVRYPDFLNATVREWWGDEQAALLKRGVAGIWNDMNEPANFARSDKTLAPDALHRTDHGPRRHAEVHNVYGSEMARASREGILRFGAARRSSPAPAFARPFVITRAGYAGVQRHALVWTGDNSSTWEHLNETIPLLLNLGLSGVPFCGADVGGFLDNCTPELFARWFQLAAFTPFFRGHSNLGTAPHEPWAFGHRVEANCRQCLNLRYQLLPLLYSLFAGARATGAPVMRPLLWHYQNDPVATACSDQFLVGRDLLVAPMLRAGAVARSVYLPNDVWFDFWTGERLTGGRHIVAEAALEVVPLYVRAGGLLPLAAARQFEGGRPANRIQLHLWPGARGEFQWYEDDGATQDYEQGKWHRRTIRSTTRKRTLEIEFGAAEGPFASRVRVWRLAIWGVRRAGRFTVNGRPAHGQYSDDGQVFLADIGNNSGRFELRFTGV